MFYIAHYASPVGRLVLASEGETLVGLWLEGQKYFQSTLSGELCNKEDMQIFNVVRAWLDRYFAGQRPDIAKLPLAPKGSEFHQKVWRLLREIPYGEVVTYGALAEKMAQLAGREHMSAQAIGGAVGHNPISIIIPCHRVVGANGSLTGYAGGVEVKLKLLKMEGVDVSKLTMSGVKL